MSKTETYIITVAPVDSGGYRSDAYRAGHTQTDGEMILEARADVRPDHGVAYDGEAWKAAADALASMMPEPDEPVSEGEREIDGVHVDWMPDETDRASTRIGVWIDHGDEPVGNVYPSAHVWIAEAWFGPPGFSERCETFDAAVEALVKNALERRQR